MTERGDRAYRWPGGRTPPDAEVDAGLPPGVPDPPDEDLLDWRSLAAIGDEQSRIYSLWRRGRIGNKAAQVRLEELEQLVSRLEAQVATRPPAPHLA